MEQDSAAKGAAAEQTKQEAKKSPAKPRALPGVCVCVHGCCVCSRARVAGARVGPVWMLLCAARSARDHWREAGEQAGLHAATRCRVCGRTQRVRALTRAA